MNGHFLDWASTSPIVRFPIDTSKQWRNPNAAYAYDERKMLMDCEERIKAAIGANGGHVLYFRCATDAFEWLHGQTVNVDGSTWWAHSPYEHDAAAYGHAATPDELDGMEFYCHQLVNQITGEIHDIKTAHEQLMQYDDVLFLICDCTAAIHHTSLRDVGVCQYADAICMSGHKIGCPDIAFMWIDDRLFEWLGGGKDVRNQWGLKHGSLSVGHVLELADAVEWACDDDALVDRDNKWFDLVSYLDRKLDGVNVKHSFVPIVPASEAGKPFALAINAIHLPGINADALQQYLATKQIYIGIGHSSCAEDADYRVLKAYGLTEQKASEVIRVSFGEDSTVEDVDALVGAICEYKEKFC